jgi:hypothetical protein
MRNLLLAICMMAGCATTTSTVRPAPPNEIADARPSVALLQAGNFTEGQHAAEQLLEKQPRNSRASLVVAVARYKAAMHQLFMDVVTVAEGAFHGNFNHRYMRTSFEEASRALGSIDDALARAADDPTISLELCLACWQVDWNHNGRVDSRDERLFEVEEDADGHEIPDGDPRRRPTFRFDLGDVYWARAMVSFQRAAIEVILAYQWEEIDRLLIGLVKGGGSFTLRIGDKQHVTRAKALVLAGLDHADRSRVEILRESDDDREWLPNPRQKSHPLPLPVDDALFATWQGVVEDLRRLVRGDEGLSVSEAAELGKHFWEHPPRGFIDIGRMFSDPRDLSFNAQALDRAREAPEAALASVFGVDYVPSMKPSGLIARLVRMKDELDRGKESFERKLKYLLWMN